MNGILPYPLLSLALLVLWLLLNQSVSAGHVILGSSSPSRVMGDGALRPEKPRIRRPGPACGSWAWCWWTSSARTSPSGGSSCAPGSRG